MSFHRFPNLPDDDPITALRLCWEYVRAVVHGVKPYVIFVTSGIAPVLFFLVAWLTLGHELALSWASDLVPLGFAVISVIVSVKTLRDKHQNGVIVFVLVAGLVGTGVMHFARTNADAQHHEEIIGLQKRMETVSGQNNLLLKAYLAQPTVTTQEAEINRKQGILKALRSEYILSHEKLSAGLLSGNEFPPSEWMNKRLAELGEKWQFRADGSRAAGISIPAARSYVLLNSPIYEKRDEKGQITEQEIKAGDPLFFNVHYRQDGPNPLEIAAVWMKGYEELDMTPSTRNQVIENFQKYIRDNPAQPKGKTATFSRGEQAFNTAYFDYPNRPRFLNQADIDDLRLGNKILFVAAQVDYLDGDKLHHARFCGALQPPAVYVARIWQTCGVGTGKSD